MDAAVAQARPQESAPIFLGSTSETAATPEAASIEASEAAGIETSETAGIEALEAAAAAASAAAAATGVAGQAPVHPMQAAL